MSGSGENSNWGDRGTNSQSDSVVWSMTDLLSNDPLETTRLAPAAVEGRIGEAPRSPTNDRIDRIDSKINIPGGPVSSEHLETLDEPVSATIVRRRHRLLDFDCASPVGSLAAPRCQDGGDQVETCAAAARHRQGAPQLCAA